VTKLHIDLFGIYSIIFREIKYFSIKELQIKTVYKAAYFF
jgi:hypothetical protein